MKLKGIILLLSVVTLSCGGSKTNELNFTTKPPFTIYKTYSQNWVAGVKGGGSGTNLIIEFSSVSEGIEFKEIYFRGKRVYASLKRENQIIGYFKSEINRDIIMDSEISKEAANIPPKKIPFQLEKNETVISYSKKGKIYYYRISNIEEKEMLAYPQSNSNIEN